MYNKPSGLMVTVHDKKNCDLQELLETIFYGFNIYYRDYFSFTYVVGDALKYFENLRASLEM